MTDNTKIILHLQHWLKEYLPNMEGKKPNTIRSYKDTWRLVIQFFLSQGIKPEEITYEMLNYRFIMDFLCDLEINRSCKVGTRNNRLAAISKFAAYSTRQDFDAVSSFYKAVSKIPYKKQDDAIERAHFTHEELTLFLDCPSPKTNMGIRDHVVLQFMYATGMRAEEVCVAKVGDIKFLKDGKASVIIHGKGGKTRRIKIFEEPASVLKKYLLYRRIGNQPEAYIFPSQRNDRMSVKCLEEIFSKYINILRKEHPNLFKETSYPPHSMRHTTAMHMLEAGVPLVVIKQFLGHEHLSTTEIYAKISPESVIVKLEKWNKEFWDKYIDEPINQEEISDSEDEIPFFLK